MTCCILPGCHSSRMRGHGQTGLRLCWDMAVVVGLCWDVVVVVGLWQ